VSLWPLRLVSERLELAAPRRLPVRLLLTGNGNLAKLFEWLAERRVDILHFDSEPDGGEGVVIDLVLGLPPRRDRASLKAELGTLDWVTVEDADRPPV
jgi:hypothetical protein